MPPEEYHPAIQKYADCRMVEMDNGRFAVCRKAEPKPGKLVLVLEGGDSVAPYVYAPPVLSSVEKAGRTLPVNAPTHQILGRMVAEFIDHGDGDD